MLQVDTYIDHSKIDGYGIFANQDIKANQIIWTLDEDTDIVLSINQINKLTLVFGDDWKKTFMKYSYHENNNFYVLHTENIRYMNHSDKPNCGGNNINNMIALKNISKGEELTENYNIYKENDNSYRACANFMQE